MEVLSVLDAPYTVRIKDVDITFPKLTLRNMGVVASKLKAIHLRQLREVCTEDGLPAEKKARFLSVTASRDYNFNDVWEWAISFEGGFELLKTSLVQGGMKEDEAVKIVNQITDPLQLTEIAMEVVDHNNSPSRVAKREIDAAAEAAKSKEQKGDESPK